MAVTTKGLKRQDLNWGAMLDAAGHDPAVDTAFGINPALDDPIFGKLAQETQRKRSMTKKQRRQAAVDAQRNKITYDLPGWLTDEISRIAKEGYYPASHLAGLLMTYGLQALREGKINPEDYRELARSPRFEFFLKYQEDEFSRKPGISGKTGSGGAR